MRNLTDAQAIELRNQKLKHYTKKEVELFVGNSLKFRCSIIGSTAFQSKVGQQLKSLLRGSYHARILLQELAKLPKQADIVEYQSNHAAYHNNLIVILFNAFMPQGYNEIRFEDEKGRSSKGNVQPDMALAHELFHIGQFQKAKFFEPYCNMICGWLGGPWELSSNALEYRTTKYINQVRLDKRHKRVRTHYHIGYGPKIDSYKNASEGRP